MLACRKAADREFFRMLHIVLVEPEIPANTGNIARTCAATGSVLHLVKPLGFDISDKAVKRAGLDYWHLVDVRVYEDLDEFFAKNQPACMRLFSTKAPAATTRPITLTGRICSSERKRRACRRSFWLRITTAASASPSVRRHGASTSAIPPPSACLRRCGSRISRI